MKNLYKLNDFIGKLPNPKHFPIQGAIINAIEGRPYIFTDGFILDLFVREADKVMLEKRVSRTINTISISSFLSAAEKSELLLSEAEFIYETTFLTYIVFTPEGHPVGIQVKYYKYFRNRYPECNFYKKEEGIMLISIKVGKEVVGLCMPIVLNQETCAEIAEERK